MTHPHAVHFYDDTDILLSRLGAYIEKGLQANASVIVIARNEVLGQVKGCVAPEYRDRFVGLDAHTTLSSFMVEGLPDRSRFMQSVGGVVDRAARRSTHVYAFGEMVNILWEDGNHVAALQLEAFWNDLMKVYPFTLLCAYASDLMKSSQVSKSIICSEHSQIISYDDPLSAPAF